MRAVAAGVLLEPRSDDLHEADRRSLLCIHSNSRLKAPATFIHLLELFHADGFVWPRKLHRRCNRQQRCRYDRCANLAGGLCVSLPQGGNLHLLFQHGEEFLLILHAFLLL